MIGRIHGRSRATGGTIIGRHGSQREVLGARCSDGSASRALTEKALARETVQQAEFHEAYGECLHADLILLRESLDRRLIKHVVRATLQVIAQKRLGHQQRRRERVRLQFNGDRATLTALVRRGDSMDQLPVIRACWRSPPSQLRDTHFKAD